MRNLINSDCIFDTQIDTKKIFVAMKHKFEPHNYVAKDGKSLLYLHVWEKHPAQKIPTEIYIERKYWDFDKKRVSKSCPGAEDTNLVIAQIEAKITAIKIRFRLSETLLTTENFLEEFQHGMPRMDFIEYFYYAKERDFKAKNIKFNTWKKENSVYKILKEFKPKILFSDISKKQIEKFVTWRKENGMANSTINSNLAIIKKYIGQATEDGIKMGLVTKQIKVGSTNGHREALSTTELKKLKSYYESEFLRDNHKVPLCRFLFSCFTGIRIGDNQNISAADFYEGQIIFEAEKTEKTNKIAINNTAKKILDRCPEVFFKTLTDQHVNEKLQEAASFLGIRTHVTFHVSRHTFATNFLNVGGKVETLQKILDHESIETTMIYVHVNKEQQNKEMMLLDNLFSE